MNFSLLKMSDIGFNSLPTGKLHKKPWQNGLKSFPAGYVGRFCRNLADNVDKFVGSDFYGRIANDSNIVLTLQKGYRWPLINDRVT